MSRLQHTLHRSQRLWRTLSYLRPQQLGGQLWHRLRPLWHRWLPRTTPGPLPPTTWQNTKATEATKTKNTSEILDRDKATWYPPPHPHDADALRQGRFTFINETHQVGFPPDWTAPQSTLLWRYNLHYFDWLWTLPPQDAFRLAQDWIATGISHQASHVGWQPYPTSLRLLNWYGYFFITHPRSLSEAQRQAIWESIYHQAEWLSHHLEFHLMGNHLLENLVALAIVGSGFAGDAPGRWLAHATPLLQQELREQILPDGMHFERSPMYHLRIVYLVLLLQKFGAPQIAAVATRQLPKMCRAMVSMSHPDQQIALFNDSAFGIYHEPSQLLAWSHHAIPNTPRPPKQTDTGPWALPDAGYFGTHTDDGHAVICDAGPIGPDYIPGHAHADIFSFELSLNHQRVIVDSGVCDYLETETRRYCRSTAGHNTITIEGKDQCELWGAFRVARRGKPHDVSWQSSESGFRLSGWHDGYQHLPGAPRHHRTFQWSNNPAQLQVEDTLTATTSISSMAVASYLHLHPCCDILALTPQEASIQTPAGHFTITWHGEGLLQCEEGIYCPTFGQTTPNQVLVFRCAGTQLRLGYTIRSGVLP